MGADTKNEIIGEVMNAVFIICFFIVIKTIVCFFCANKNEFTIIYFKINQLIYNVLYFKKPKINLFKAM